MPPPTDEPPARDGPDAGGSGAGRGLSAVPRWAGFAAGAALGGGAWVGAASALGWPLPVAVPIAVVTGLMGVAGLRLAEPIETGTAPGGPPPTPGTDAAPPSAGHPATPGGPAEDDDGEAWIGAVLRVLGPIALILGIGIGIGIVRGVTGGPEPTSAGPPPAAVQSTPSRGTSEALKPLVVRPEDLSDTGLPELTVIDDAEGPGTDFLQILPFVDACATPLDGVAGSWERIMDRVDDLPAVYHTVVRFESDAAARAAVRDLRAEAARCPGGDGETAVIDARTSGRDRESMLVLRLPDDDPSYVSSTLLVARHGAVVHGVTYVPTVLRRAGLRSHAPLDAVGRAADRRVRAGLADLEP